MNDYMIHLLRLAATYWQFKFNIYGCLLNPLNLASTDDIHVILGRPLFAVPSTLPCNVIFSILFLSMQST